MDVPTFSPLKPLRSSIKLASTLKITSPWDTSNWYSETSKDWRVGGVVSGIEFITSNSVLIPKSFNSSVEYEAWLPIASDIPKYSKV